MVGTHKPQISIMDQVETLKAEIKSGNKISSTVRVHRNVNKITGNQFSKWNTDCTANTTVSP